MENLDPFIALLTLPADVCMMQTYSGNTALSSPGEEVVHHRKGGWFLTYKKVLSFIVLTVVVVIVAGLIGWNIGTMPKTRVSRPLCCMRDVTPRAAVLRRFTIIEKQRYVIAAILDIIASRIIETAVAGNGTIHGYHASRYRCVRLLPRVIYIRKELLRLYM